MGDLTCSRCNGPAVRVQQDGSISCVRQCHETMTDELLRKELEGLTRALAELVAAHMPKGYVFTLILASASDGVERAGSMAYVSTAQRTDNLSMLREMADKLDASGDAPS